jgi:hypothetical protein
LASFAAATELIAFAGNSPQVLSFAVELSETTGRRQSQDFNFSPRRDLRLNLLKERNTFPPQAGSFL